MPKAESSLRQRIDSELMQLDYILCEQGRRIGVPRPEIRVIGLISSQLDAMLSAFAQDDTLWSRFRELVMTPRQPAFDSLFKKAHISSSLEEASQDSVSCDPMDLAYRINVLSRSNLIDNLTVHAVAYVLGGNSKLHSRFYQAVENHPFR